MLTIAAGVVIGLLLLPVVVALLPLVLRFLGFAILAGAIMVALLIAASVLRPSRSNTRIEAPSMSQSAALPKGQARWPE